MKKKILMVGNTNGLRGVPADMHDYYSFFTSPIGGNWCDEEIDRLWNPCKRCLFKKINEIERADYDYVITIFTGHGGETDSGTVLNINGRKERIVLNDLTNLSRKQLLIFDCCRHPVLIPFDIKAEGTILSMSRDPIRKEYENRILASGQQKIILFACDRGEYAEDTGYGGLYSQCLLIATETELANSDSPFVSVSRAHYEAVALMKREKAVMRQHPQILQSHCAIQRRLPLAINPNFWNVYD